MIRRGDIAIWNFPKCEVVGRRSVGPQYIGLLFRTLISYTPLRYVRNVAKRSKKEQNAWILHDNCPKIFSPIFFFGGDGQVFPDPLSPTPLRLKYCARPRTPWAHYTLSTSLGDLTLYRQLYTVSQKIRYQGSVITSSNTCQFSKFFHCHSFPRKWKYTQLNSPKSSTNSKQK